MDARLLFQWHGETAKNLVTAILGDTQFVADGECDDVIRCDDADYEVWLRVRLKHKKKPRKPRAKKPE